MSIASEIILGAVAFAAFMLIAVAAMFVVELVWPVVERAIFGGNDDKRA